MLRVLLPLMCLLNVCITEETKDCRLESFGVQEEFNIMAFQGHWYVISVNQFWITLPGLSKLLTPKNIQATYTVNPTGDVNVTVCGSVIGPFCDFMTGFAEVTDKLVPQKIDIQFNTMFLPAAKPRPYWVISTDYEYAAVYSCFDIQDDGDCRKDKAYLWTLDRNYKGHTLAQQAAIDEAARSVCIEPGNGNFRQIKQDGGCDISNAHLHTGPGLIFVLLTVIMGFFMIIICCTCFLSRSDKVSETKKRQ